MRETVRDLDVIATATDPQALVDYFCSLRWVVEVAAKGSTKATVVSHDGLRFDLRVVPPESYGNLLQHFTGSKDHNVALREDAVRRGLSVSEYSITDIETGDEHAFATEEEVYRFLGYAWIPPELREDAGELAAARRDALPELVQLSDLRGDLHTHTTWSDGKDSLEDMVAAAIARGYAYYAICDHSQRLRGDLLKQQSEEIDALNELVAPFRILKGIEVNVRPERHARRLGRGARNTGLGRRVRSFALRPRSDRARARGDGEPVRRLHRPSHEQAHRQAAAGRSRPRARARGGGVDGHVPRAQLAARSPRPLRRARARCA